MGGKRPDQYEIDPAEAGATDYKFRDQGEKLRNADKQRFVESEQREKSLIPESIENPVRAELRSRKSGAAESSESRASAHDKAHAKPKPKAKGKGGTRRHGG